MLFQENWSNKQTNKQVVYHTPWSLTDGRTTSLQGWAGHENITITVNECSEHRRTTGPPIAVTSLEERDRDMSLKL